MSSTSMTKEKTRLLEILKRDAYVKGEVTLSSGKKSDYYIDARRVTLTAEGVSLTAGLILDKINNPDVTAIGGPTLGADPMIGALGVLSHQSAKPYNTFIIRKESKAHGKKKQVEGPVLKKGDTVVLIDDVATTGKAIIHSIGVLKGLGIQIDKAICIVDRGEGAKEAIEALGVPLDPLFQITEIHDPS